MAGRPYRVRDHLTGAAMAAEVPGLAQTPAEMLGAGTPRPPLPDGAPVLSPEQEYDFDVAGFLHVPGVLTSAAVEAANAAVDGGGSDSKLLALTDASPVLTGLLIQLFWSEETGDLRHGAQFTLEEPPALLEPLAASSSVVPPPLEGGTAEDGGIDTSRSYFNAAGHRFCHGLKVVVALAAAPADAGGYVLVPGSHKSSVGTPSSVRSGAADHELESLGLLQRPALAAGDCLIIASSLLQGRRAWQGQPGGQRLVCWELIAGQARSAYQVRTRGLSFGISCFKKKRDH